MNRRMVVNTLGRIILIESVLMFIPFMISAGYGEWNAALAFGITFLAAGLAGFLTVKITAEHDRGIHAREGFVIAAFSWILMSLIGAVPLVVSGEFPSYIDALFEIVSGFTTTGASVVRDLSVLSHGILFWRSFTHWIGGMGVLVLMMAIIPDDSGRSIFIMRAEMPGPVVDKIVPKVKNTAKILYLIYFVLTAAEVIMLLFGGMDLFESLVHSMGTAGTGGFGIRADSLGSYSPYCQWVITAFMLLFGLNFNLYYLIIAGKIRSALRSEEMHVYLGIAVVSTTIIAINVARMYSTVGEVIRHSAFQMASILTTTGFSTVDFNQWPGLSKTILVVLMCIGGCAGSTAGGLKVSRVILIIKGIGSEIKHLLHPRSITRGTFEGKGITKELRSGVNSYFALYILVFAVTFIIVSFESFDFETNATAVIACMNNIGPGLAGVGPAAGYYDYSVVSKLVLSLAMLMGRLELYPIILAMASIGKRNIGSARLSQTKRAVRRS